MSGVRLADIPDIDALCELGRELLEQSVYAGIKPDEYKFKTLLAGLMGSKNGTVLVVTDDDNQPQGFLLGMVDELFFSREKYATDLAVYARKAYRQYVPAMYRRFVKWASNRPKVVQISMGISSGIGDAERIGRMYELMGFDRTGGLYARRV